MADNNHDLLNGVLRGLTGVRVDDSIHASRGGRAYPKEVRELVLQMILNGGIDAVKTRRIRQLMFHKKFPSLTTCRRWPRQHLTLGHIHPKRRTCNRHANREINGEALVQLVAFYRAVRPHARLYEVKAYLSNRFPLTPVYSDSQIHCAETRLGLLRKVSSRTSQDAYRPINLGKRRLYWERAYPLGIADQSTSRIIEIDEPRFTLESADRKFGKVAREFRCNLRGNYKKGEPGSNLIMAIFGDDNNTYEFHQQYTEGGTDLWRLYCFMRDLIADLAVNFPGVNFCFTLDNLKNIHKHPAILEEIESSGHRVVYRDPYWSCDGAIEYVFNAIHTYIEMDDGFVMENVDDLVNRINLIIGSMASFRRYFLHVGFQDKN